MTVTGHPTARRVIRTGAAPNVALPISQAVAHGTTLYVGGQAGLLPATGKLVEGGFEEQFRQALANLDAVVRAAGARLQDALKVTVYLADIGDYDAMNAIYAGVFATDPPARKVIQSQLLPGFRAEVDAIVALTSPQTDKKDTLP